LQKEQLGTAHALFCAKDLIREADDVLVLYGDHPKVSPETIKKIAKVHNSVITMMTTKLKDFDDWRKTFYNWGRIVRGGSGEIQKIIEFKDASDEEKEIKEVNPAIYCFSNIWLWANIQKIDNNNEQKEYYLTDLIKLAFEQNQEINSLLIDPEEAVGINSREELEMAERLLS
jgi:bifunctional UDP-N-acetylglucosamine pyrophosphorylase/glucosamine-1-phosphate N-acetyltransferase